MLSLNFQDVFVVVTSIVLTTAIVVTIGRKIRKIDFLNVALTIAYSVFNMMRYDT